MEFCIEFIKIGDYVEIGKTKQTGNVTKIFRNRFREPVCVQVKYFDHDKQKYKYDYIPLENIDFWESDAYYTHGDY